ncbi:hypothetical protein H5410_050601 [Solanum commersonii]|uniref:Uncharacterized protein n=1 Tax=Solanum commersonii TaxID=4109 RepID=A0A9J5WYD2_SOLCO|nr:hypothetical protein H5410_050601 [Solanum commersonii]
MKFSIPWINKWTPEVGFTDEQIHCLYRTFYNKFGYKLMNKDPQTKTLYKQELLDLIEATTKEYCLTPQKGIMQDSFVRYIARKISIQEGDKEKMIHNYLDEVTKKFLLNITQYEKSDTSMQSETSDDVTYIQESQLYETTSEDVLEKAGDFLHKLKGKEDKISRAMTMSG